MKRNLLMISILITIRLSLNLTLTQSTYAGVIKRGYHSETKGGVTATLSGIVDLDHGFITGSITATMNQVYIAGVKQKK